MESTPTYESDFGREISIISAELTELIDASRFSFEFDTEEDDLVLIIIPSAQVQPHYPETLRLSESIAAFLNNLPDLDLTATVTQNYFEGIDIILRRPKTVIK